MGYDIPSDHSSSPRAQPAYGERNNFGRVWNDFEWVLEKDFIPKHAPWTPPLSPEQKEAEETHTLKSSIRQILGVIEGNSSGREGLAETPERVAKAMLHWFGGYNIDVGSILATQFQDGGEGYDEMVIVKDIPFYSKCEHHMADIFGTVTVAYIPNGKVVGLSKLSRTVDAFARRLQVQERFTKQIADAIVEHLQPVGVGVLVKARHMCMESRGIRQQGHSTITSALRGVLKSDAAARAEFIALA